MHYRLIRYRFRLGSTSEFGLARLIARIMPIRAIITGPPRSTSSSSASQCGLPCQADRAGRVPYINSACLAARLALGKCARWRVCYRSQSALLRASTVLTIANGHCDLQPNLVETKMATTTREEIRSLSLDDLDAVAGGADASVHVHLNFFGSRWGISVTDTPNGPMTCVTHSGPSGHGGSCTVPV